MVDRLAGNPGSGLARAAIEAALRRKDEALERMSANAATPEVREAKGPDFKGELVKGIRELDGQLNAVEKLPEKIVRGEIQDLHEIAAQLKRADLSMKFAYQVRNKLIDAYREIMRMSV